VRLVQIMWAALRGIGHGGTAPRAGEPLARPAGTGVSSGWIGPDGRVEEASGTAVHVALVARFGEPTKDGFFAKGAIRYVDASDHVSLEGKYESGSLMEGSQIGAQEMRLVPAHADLVTTQIHVAPMAGVALDFASMIRTCPLAWTQEGMGLKNP